MKPIYEPKGAAKEYGDFAINIYTGCPHGCFYCFAPSVLHRDRKKFHTEIAPRTNIVEETRKQLERENISGKLIHLCFTCDPYPTGYDSIVTRDIIRLLKKHGNHIQILTKGDGIRDFDLLDSEDWYGITIDGLKMRPETITSLIIAHRAGIKTWVSFEPVVNAGNVLMRIEDIAPYADRIKIGKLNYHPSDINWAKFGRQAETICKRLGIDYYIKDSLRAEMEKRA